MRMSVFLLVLAIGSSSCKDSGSPVDFGNPSAPIYPLAAGNSWSYKISYYDTLGVLFQVSNYTLTIGATTVVAGQQWYFWHDPSQYLINLPSGTWYRVIQTDTTTQAELFYKYPAAVGDSWYTVRFMSDTLNMTLISANTVIEVPAGRFGCHVYNYVGSRSVDYLVPGVGLVYSETHPTLPSGRSFKYVWELMSYKLK